MKGEFDHEVWTAIEPSLSPGDTFLDIGCNIGYYAVLAAKKVGPSGEVHAFDVDPRPLRCLQKTLTRNQLYNVIIHPYAIGEAAGVSSLITSAESGITRLSAGHNGPQFPVLNLDAWAEYFKNRPVSAVKVDVEGHDEEVLRGASAILRRHRPVVVSEGNPIPDYSEKEEVSARIREFMVGLRYKVRPIEGAINQDMLFDPLCQPDETAGAGSA